MLRFSLLHAAYKHSHRLLAAFTSSHLLEWHYAQLKEVCFISQDKDAKKGLDGQVRDSFDIFLQTGFSPSGFPATTATPFYFDKITSVGNQGL